MILVPDTLSQFGGGTFGILDDSAVIGGLHVCLTTTARNAIPSGSRKQGTIAFVVATGLFYSLGSNLSTWTEVAGGVGGPGGGDTSRVDTIDDTPTTLLSMGVDDDTPVAFQADVFVRKDSTTWAKIRVEAVAEVSGGVITFSQQLATVSLSDGDVTAWQVAFVDGGGLLANLQVTGGASDSLSWSASATPFPLGAL